MKNEFQELVTVEQWRDLYERSANKRIFLFKHSTTCPISAKANEEVHQFAENYDGKDAEFAFLKVRESRPVSNAIEADLQIKHESPQFFIIENKEVKWCDSHWNITKEKIEEALQAIQ